MLIAYWYVIAGNSVCWLLHSGYPDTHVFTATGRVSHKFTQRGTTVRSNTIHQHPADGRYERPAMHGSVLGLYSSSPRPVIGPGTVRSAPAAPPVGPGPSDKGPGSQANRTTGGAPEPPSVSGQLGAHGAGLTRSPQARRHGRVVFRFAFLLTGRSFETSVTLCPFCTWPFSLHPSQKASLRYAQMSSQF